MDFDPFADTQARLIARMQQREEMEAALREIVRIYQTEADPVACRLRMYNTAASALSKHFC